MFPHARRQSRRDSRAPASSRPRAGAWRSLRAGSSSASILPDAKDDARSPPTPSDLAAIRRRLIEQREGRLAAGLPWRLEGSKPKKPRAHRPDILVDARAPARGGGAASRGDHSDAWCTRALELANDSEPRTSSSPRARWRPACEDSACLRAFIESLSRHRARRARRPRRVPRARSRAVDARRVSSDTTTRGWISSWRCV